MPVRWHQALPYPVQRLQVELIRGLGRHELHGRSLHRLGDGLGIAEVILLALRVGAHTSPASAGHRGLVP